jgi:hypothetical protein
MGDQSGLVFSARERFMKLANYLDAELIKLQQAGVLTEVDKLKLIEDSKLSAQAVLNAIGRTDYPARMQEELVNRLINLYEVTVEDILNNARERLYSTDQIQAKLVQIANSVLPDLESLVRNRLITKEQRNEIIKRVNEINSEVLDGIISIPRNHPKRHELIDTWLVDHKGRLLELVQRYLPRLVAQRPLDQEEHPTKTSRDGVK